MSRRLAIRAVNLKRLVLLITASRVTSRVRIIARGRHCFVVPVARASRVERGRVLSAIALTGLDRFEHGTAELPREALRLLVLRDND